MKTQFVNSSSAQIVPDVGIAIAKTWLPFRDRLSKWYAQLAPLLAISTIFALIIFTNLGVWLVVGTAFFATIILIRTEQDRHIIALKVMTLIIAVSALDYSIWRLQVVNWQAWYVGIPLFAAEFFGILHTLGFQFTVWPRQEQALRMDEDPTHRPIFIFIPTVNEGTAILSQTIRGAQRARDKFLAAYPHGQVTIVICNDGRVAEAPGWEKIELLARAMHVECITRTVKGGAKAGNIENARMQTGATGDALIVIFDADQIAEPDFLIKVIAPFSDARIGWVQTGQFYRNLENPVTNWANDQQSLFYNVLCPGKSKLNAAFICGTNVMLRAAALDEIGGLPQDSVTEDFAASIVLHSRWQSVFLPGLLATGLGPMTLKSYLKQQERWAIGTLGVFRKSWTLIFLPGRSSLTLPQRIQYALACTHYLSGLRDLVYILMPMIFILTGISAIKGADLASFLGHFLPYYIASQVVFWYMVRGKTSLRGTLIGFGSFYAVIKSLYIVVVGKRVGFSITSKTRNADSAWQALRPHMIVFGLCIPAIIVAVLHQVDLQDNGKMLVSLLWVLYTGALLGGMFWLGYADNATANGKQPRGIQFNLRRLTSQFAVLHQNPKRVIAIGTALAFILIFVLIYPSLGAINAKAAPPFSVHVGTEPIRFGLTLPADLLKSDPELVKARLKVRPGIIGRVQSIDDRLDTGWVNDLLAKGQRPWITLIFHAHGAPVYMSSLAAIANGIYDSDLQQWASSIRQFGKPVYLTILPHVDRNWSLSSAVTNGGIPQDVPRAWLHVQKIFAAANVENVAWAWAPADPANDQPYAPPKKAIDVVVLSLISYPNTLWVDPQKAIQDVVNRYPKLPMFVEVSAAGNPEQKAAWLKQVGMSIPVEPNVVALLYHDGSPDTAATSQQHQDWLMASDPLSLDAAQTMIKTAGLQKLEVKP